MSAFSKIRVALIGVSAPPFGTPSGTNWAASDHMPYLTSSSCGPDLLQVEVCDASKDTLTQLPTVEDSFAHLLVQARNVARLYQAFAKAKTGDRANWYPDFEYGLRKHDLTDAMYRENNM